MSIRYREDLDFLRFFSIISVLFYHLDLGFFGGYLGVDIFFVLSGFLITRIIDSKISEDKFSLTSFYLKRMLRLFPAFALVSLVTLVVSYFFLLEEDFISSVNTFISSLFYSSDTFLLYNSNNYFMSNSENNVFLHTWSLYIEEKIYLIFPLLLVAIKERKKEVIFFIFIISLSSSIFLENYSKTFNFYFFFSRLWEFLAGALLVYIPAFKFKKSANETAILILNFLTLTFIILHESFSSLFPRVSIVLTILSSCSFIYISSGNVFQRTFSSSLVKFFSKMSYSIYLIHWPVITLVKSTIIVFDFKFKLISILITLLLSYLSMRFVETPFRKYDYYSLRKRKIFLYYLLICSSLIVMSLIFKKYQSTYSLPGKILGQDIRNELKIFNNFRSSSVEPVVHFKSNRKRSLIVWGDSHGLSLMPKLEEIARKYDYSLEHMLTPGIPPLINVERSNNKIKTLELKNLSLKRLDLLKSQKNKDILIVSRWINHCSHKLTTIDSRNDESELALQKSLALIVKPLLVNNSVYILREVPTSGNMKIIGHLYNSLLFPTLNKLNKFGEPRDLYVSRRICETEVFSKLKKEFPKLIILDPINSFYGDNDLFKVYEGKLPYYRDYNHVTIYGVSNYLGNLLETIFR